MALPESRMIPRAGLHGLSLAIALALAASGLLSAEAVAQEDVAQQAATKAQSSAAGSPPKADLDQSAVRIAAVARAPRPTLVSSRGIALPKILGSYR